MKNITLDKEEAVLLASIENDEWESVPNLEEEIRMHGQYAGNTLNREQSPFDVPGIRTKATTQDILKSRAAYGNYG
jgi:hypothetical protein